MTDLSRHGHYGPAEWTDAGWQFVNTVGTSIQRITPTDEELEAMRVAASRFIPTLGCVLGWYCDVPAPWGVA